MTTPYRILVPPVPYDAKAHLKRIQKLYKSYPLNTPQKKSAYIELLIRSLPERYKDQFREFLRSLLINESVFLSVDDTPLYSDELTHHIYTQQEQFLAHFDLEKITAALVNFIGALSDHLPEGESNLYVPLIELLPEPRLFVQRLSAHYDCFPRFKEAMLRNTFEASGMDYDSDYTETQLKRLTFAVQSDLPPLQLARTYLKNTPLLELYETRVSFAIPASVRNEHFLMIARTGSGKTQFIQRDILDHLMLPDPPGMVVIDSQNQMIPKLERLQVAKDRIIIIDPFDPSPPALNMFVTPPRKRDFDPHLKEVIEAKTLQQFAWIFSALDQELTGRQTTLFTFTARVLLSMRSNMQTLLDFMQIKKIAELRASKFWPSIEGADEQTRFFFDNRFCTDDYNKTKGGVADRLLGVLRIPAFNRMFMAPDNRLDLYTELANRKLVVFNTHKGRLGDDASSILGRYAISLYIRAAFERELDSDPPPAFLYVDEASEYFGKKDISDTLFTQLRKYNCGTFVAFQDLSQLGEQHHTLIANTTTKLTGGLSVADAKKLAPDMRTTDEELLTIRKEPGSFEVMCYVNNVTPSALRLSFEYGAVENARKLDDNAHTRLRELNRQRFGSRPAAAQTPPPQPAPSALQPVSEPKPIAQPPAPAAPASQSAPPFAIKPGKDWKKQ